MVRIFRGFYERERWQELAMCLHTVRCRERPIGLCDHEQANGGESCQDQRMVEIYTHAEPRSALPVLACCAGFT